MPKKHKRQTKAVKIIAAEARRAALAAAKLTPWYPAPAASMGEAIEVLIGWWRDRDEVAETIETLDARPTPPRQHLADERAEERERLVLELAEINSRIDTLPLGLLSTALEVFEARKRHEEAMEDADDPWDDADFYEEPPLFPVGFLAGLSDAALAEEIDRLAGAHDVLGDAEYINESAVERARLRFDAARDERDRRYRQREQTVCPVCNSDNGHSIGCASLNLDRRNIEGVVL